MTFTGNVGCNLHLVGQPDSGYLSKGRVGLFRGNGPDLDTYSPLLRGVCVSGLFVF